MGPNYVSAEKAYTDRVIELLTLRVGMINYLNTEVSRETLTPGSWGAKLYEAVDRGEITEVAVPKLLVDYVGPALDTTISAIGSMVWLFAQNPVQWDRLRKNPALIFHCNHRSRPT